jgi:pimeloyl-ACP methyl ester carboxylesterase
MLVPEIDQIKLGIVLAAILDQRIDIESASRLARITLPIYRAMDPEVHDLRPALGYGYRELFGMLGEDEHLYAYAPPKAEERPAVLLFLHGAAGNFQSYVYLLSQLSERRMIVVCPTQGFGIYRDRARFERTVERARRHAIDVLGGDPDRVFLAALSQGGVAGTRIASSSKAYLGLILISPVLDRDALDRWSGPPVLLIHGARDDRVPIDYVQDGLTRLRARSATVTAEIFPEEDHFLLYSSWSSVEQIVSEWIER